MKIMIINILLLQHNINELYKQLIYLKLLMVYAHLFKILCASQT